MRQGRKLSIPWTASDWDIASLGIARFDQQAGLHRNTTIDHGELTRSNEWFELMVRLTYSARQFEGSSHGRSASGNGREVHGRYAAARLIGATGPLGRAGEPAEIAEAVMWLLSPGLRTFTVRSWMRPAVCDKEVFE